MYNNPLILRTKNDWLLRKRKKKILKILHELLSLTTGGPSCLVDRYYLS